MPTPTARPLRTLAAALLVTAAVVGVGVLLGGAPAPVATPPAPEPEATSTPLPELDTTTVAVLREPFCAGLPPEQVAAALGSDPVTSTSYVDGETAQLTGRVRDVAHEHACGWTAADGTAARAWVFAPPVTVDRAEGLVAEATGAPGCTPVAGAPAYGAPSAALLCRTGGGGRQVSFRGLFGDAWLACSLDLPAGAADVDPARRDVLLDRAGRWCASAAVAAAVAAG